jgi:DNA replication protein DnaC
MSNFNEILGIVSVEQLKEGARLARRNSGKGCVLCDYSGYTNNMQGKAVMCSCQKEKIFADLFARANVPKPFFGKSVDDWNTRTDSEGNDLGIQQSISEKIFIFLNFYNKHIKKIVNGHLPRIKHAGNATNDIHSLMFEGSIGSGKTFIAAVLVQSAIRQGLTAKYYDWSEILDIITDFNKKDDADNLAEELKNLDFIAIDGIESYNNTHPSFIQNLDRLSKARLHSGKPSVLLSIGNANQISVGSGWNSLLRNCLTIRLPHVK